MSKIIAIHTIASSTEVRIQPNYKAIAEFLGVEVETLRISIAKDGMIKIDSTLGSYLTLTHESFKQITH